ncbi:adenylate cyclase type 2 isoform X2 [Anabrus simplex]|uniref:adenylate cyclase type 2 isoform X2 n=1 Tax=Anabrus simplex TaxID=316456 RepID=UPI0034DD518E
MSTSGIELLTRSSLNSIRNSSQTSSSLLRDSLASQTTDERNWSWKYLRHQFWLKNLEDLYEHYQQRLHHGYFSVFLLLQVLLCITHVAVLLTMGELYKNLPDIVTYTVVMVLCWPLVTIIFKEKLVHDMPWIPFLTSCVVIVILVIADIGLPLYRVSTYQPRIHFRPAYATQTLLACYIFLPLTENIHAFILGMTVTSCHIAVLGLLVYSEFTDKFQRLASDFIYLLSVNGFGLYFRYMNEVSIRRTFLDRRACVETTFKLDYEKQQEDHLMVSILPRHIVEDVRKDIRNIFQQLKNNPATPLRRKPFSDMYVRSHRNVSVLYADVVNYSQLTVSLQPTKLVETLNELFGRFDEASEERGVLRIKFLGDCYYCVSGIPESNPHHAKSCVDLGLDMIGIIRDVREGCRLKHNLDMRIGIHTGSILSGILGAWKWQFDVWSHDVIIANHMEQAGEPGRVHVTKQTLDHLGSQYKYKPAYGASRSPLLKKYNIETFFIVPDERHSIEENAPELRPIFNRSRSNKGIRRITSNKTGRRSSPDNVGVISRRRTAFMDNNLHQYQETLRKADIHMEKAIKKMQLGLYDRWLCREKIDPLCLTFKELNWELPFIQQADPLFKFYVACSFVVLLAMLLIQGFGMPSSHWIAWMGFGIALAGLIFLLPFTWTHFLWNEYWDPHGDECHVPQPENWLVKLFYHVSFQVVSNAGLRTVLYFVICTILTLCAMLELHITQTCSLVILMNFFFLRIHFQLKLMMGCLIMGIYSCGIWILHPSVFQNGETWNPGMEPQVAHILSIGFLTLSLHLMDRQAEYMNRLDYKWQRRLAAEQEEASTTRLVNKMLLQNILPIHVAELYLNTDRSQDELYHEEYETVAVMFATLTEYSLDGAGSMDSASEMDSLKLLNQIICDFDKILFEPCSLRVEKIKMAGWTYMAACGLDPGRRDSAAGICQKQHFTEHVVLVLARFATKMMRVLQNINRETFQTFKLRIGISHGPVTAGVVGAQKPLYDIWGDAVNMASRMDSTGVPGKIQVTEDTAKVLQQQGIQCEYRGPTYVKGKDYMTTYFVSLNADFHLVETPNTIAEDDEIDSESLEESESQTQEERIYMEDTYYISHNDLNTKL